jgi:hypothetical protein
MVALGAGCAAGAVLSLRLRRPAFHADHVRSASGAIMAIPSRMIPDIAPMKSMSMNSTAYLL